MSDLISKFLGLSLLTLVNTVVFLPLNATAQVVVTEFDSANSGVIGSIERATPMDHYGPGRGGIDNRNDYDRGGYDRGNNNRGGYDRGGNDRNRDFDRNRGGYDRDYPRRDNDLDRRNPHDRDRGGYDHDRRGYGRSCGDQAVTLLCKINGKHRSITAYTDCGNSRDGDYCDRVYTPGYYQTSMRLLYRCERGNWTWLLGNDGECKLSR